MSAPTLEAALAHARRGWPVFPVHAPTPAGLCDCGKIDCERPAKHPATLQGFKDATTDAQKVREMWGRHLGANIGLATGQLSGLIVLDVDGPKGAEVVKRNGIPLTPIGTTAKGRHYYLRHPGFPVKNKAGVFDELDSRGDGGYVVAPGSQHISGTLYAWEDGFSPDDVPLADAPEWWLERLRKGAAQKPLTTGDIIPNGSRNDTLTRIAGSMRRQGLAVPEILAALCIVNKRCAEPLPDPELECIAQGMKRYRPAAPWFDGKEFKPNLLAQAIAQEKSFLCSPIDEAGVGVRLHLYEGGVFRPNGADIARRLAHEQLGQASKPERIEATSALVKESSKVAARELNPKAMDLLNVQNGMLDWRTGELKPHSPEYRSTFQINAAYVPGVRSETLDRFLAEVFPPDALPLAEELVGYLLRPTTKFQKAFTLLGDGANGKSTFLSMLTAFLGEDSVSHISLQDLVENRFVAAELQGKLVNVYADLPSSSLEQSDVFKAIVGGDVIKAERKFGQPFKLVPTARLLFSANELPKSRDLSPAYFRRWVIIPFPNRFQGSKAKKDLLDLLTTPEARSGLLGRAVAGLGRLEAQQDFTACASVQEAGQTYRRQCDNAFEFISERLEAKSGATVGKKEVYQKYKDWGQGAGITHPASQRAFNKRLGEVLGATESRADGVRVWAGLDWKPEPVE